MREISGDHSGGETPVPIPNTAVKPTSADGTALATGWESRSLPGISLLYSAGSGRDPYIPRDELLMIRAESERRRAQTELASSLASNEADNAVPPGPRFVRSRLMDAGVYQGYCVPTNWLSVTVFSPLLVR